MSGSRFRPKLRSVLTLTHGMVLLLPLAGIAGLRIYQNALVRQTQAELVSQAGLVSALFAEKVSDYAYRQGAYEGLATDEAGRTHAELVPAPIDMLRAEILAPQPAPVAVTTEAHASVRKAGRVTSFILRKARAVTLTGCRIVDVEGRIVASSGGDLGLSLAGMPEIQAALKGAPSVTLRQRVPEPGEHTPALGSIGRGARLRLNVCLPIFDHARVLGAVLMSRTPIDVRKDLYEKRFAILATFGFFLVLILLIAGISAFFVTRPIDILVQQAGKLARHERDWDAVKPHAVTAEALELSEAVASMAATLEKRGDYIRDFARHVSHEFKTPLTSLRGTTELLQDHWASMSDEKRSSFLANLSQDSARLDRLVSRLLELAQAEMARTEQSEAPLAPLFHQLKARYGDLGLEVSAQDQGMSAGLPTEVLEAALSNLLSNSLQHGAKRAEILTARQGAQLVLTLKDDGPGISPANAAKVFTPFFTTQRAHGGTGLGLTITQALLEAHQGTISLLPDTEHSGASFRITVPAAKP